MGTHRAYRVLLAMAIFYLGLVRAGSAAVVLVPKIAIGNAVDSTPSYIASYANDANGYSSNSQFVTTLPYSNTVVDSRSGNTVTTTGSLTTAGFSATFYDIRSGARFGFAESQFDTTFAVTTASIYSIAGNYAVSDKGLNGGAVVVVRMFDVTDPFLPITVFDFQDESRVTTNPAFNVEVPTGDYAPATFSTGSLGGLLRTGHDYFLDVQAWTDSPLGLDQGGTGIGGITLDVTPVPEVWPAAAISLISMIAVIRRQRNKIAA